jgi:hypothetical protein
MTFDRRQPSPQGNCQLFLWKIIVFLERAARVSPDGFLIEVRRSVIPAWLARSGPSVGG